MKRALLLLAVSACGSFSAADPRIADGGVEEASTVDRDADPVPEPPVAGVRFLQQTEIGRGADLATAKFGSPLTMGSTVIAVGFWYNNLDARISSNCGLSFKNDGRSPAKGYRVQIFYAENSAGGPCSLSLVTSSTGPVQFGLVAFEYAGLAKTNVLADGHSNNATGTPPTAIGSLVMNATRGGLVLAAFANREMGPITLLQPLEERASTTQGIIIKVGTFIAPTNDEVRPGAVAGKLTAEWISVGASFNAAR